MISIDSFATVVRKLLRDRERVLEQGQGFYLLTWKIIGFGTIAAAALVVRTGMITSFKNIWVGIAGLSTLFAIHLLYRHCRPEDRLQSVAGSVFLLFFAAIVAAHIAHVGMRLRFPFIDDALASIDGALGIKNATWIGWFSEHPSVSMFLGLAYVSVVPIVFLTAIALSLSGHSDRVWELVWVYSAAIIICALVSVFLPAYSSFSVISLTDGQLAALPEGSGIFHAEAVQYYRYGSQPTIDFTKMSGVVTFPSFHVIMAICVAYALRGMGVLTIFAFCGFAAVAISTIPIGGHYVVDVIAGIMLWGILLLMGLQFDRAKQMTGEGTAKPQKTMSESAKI